MALSEVLAFAFLILLAFLAGSFSTWYALSRSCLNRENMVLRLLFEERTEKKEFVERLQATLQPAALAQFREDEENKALPGGIANLSKLYP